MLWNLNQQKKKKKALETQEAKKDNRAEKEESLTVFLQAYS